MDELLARESDAYEAQIAADIDDSEDAARFFLQQLQRSEGSTRHGENKLQKTPKSSPKTGGLAAFGQEKASPTTNTSNADRSLAEPKEPIRLTSRGFEEKPEEKSAFPRTNKVHPATGKIRPIEHEVSSTGQ